MGAAGSKNNTRRRHRRCGRQTIIGTWPRVQPQRRKNETYQAARAGGTLVALPDKIERVNRAAILQHLKVQVGAGGATR